ncbi:MAG: hypothetical protein R3200_15415, partial [Xanthomonadales bacterium]|nr:hypothetical protein [Xanthomonadales bacterium]
ALGIAFLIFALALARGMVDAGEHSTDLALWMVYELGAAFILGLFHFVTFEDPRMPRWSRIVFAACCGVYIFYLLRHAWFVVLPLVAAKAFSLWLHGTLTEEEFSHRLLKGMYLLLSLVIGMTVFAVLDATGYWPGRNEPLWPLAVMIGIYYIGLGLWQVFLAALKRIPTTA